MLINEFSFKKSSLYRAFEIQKHFEDLDKVSPNEIMEFFPYDFSINVEAIIILYSIGSISEEFLGRFNVN